MKKLSYLLFISLLTLSSCLGDDDDDIIPIAAADIVGNWSLTEFYSNDGEISTQIAGIETPLATLTMEGHDFDMDVMFNDNPKSGSSVGNFSVTATLTPLSALLSFNQPETEEITVDTLNEMLAGDWSLQNDYLMITSNGETITLEIVDFSDSMLKLKVAMDEEYELEEYNGRIVATYNLTLNK